MFLCYGIVVNNSTNKPKSQQFTWQSLSTYGLPAAQASQKTASRQKQQPQIMS